MGTCPAKASQRKMCTGQKHAKLIYSLRHQGSLNWDPQAPLHTRLGSWRTDTTNSAGVWRSCSPFTLLLGMQITQLPQKHVASFFRKMDSILAKDVTPAHSTERNEKCNHTQSCTQMLTVA